MRATDIVDDAFFHDLAGLFLARIRSPKELAYRLGVSAATISRACNDPRFQSIYALRRTEHVERLDDFIIDEKQETDERLEALRTRSVTLAAEIMQEVGERVRGKTARASEMKVGVDAAFGVMDRAPGGRQSSGSTTFVYAPTLQQAKIITDAATEAGIDMSSVFDAEVVVESTPQVEKEDTDVENESE